MSVAKPGPKAVESKEGGLTSGTCLQSARFPMEMLEEDVCSRLPLSWMEAVSRAIILDDVQHALQLFWESSNQG